MSHLRQAASGASLPVWTWSATRGLVRDGQSSQPGTTSAGGAIGFLAEVDGPGVFVFHDVGHVLEDHVTLRAIKERALEATPAQTFVLTGATISVPDELLGLALLWTLEPPSDAEVQRLVAVLANGDEGTDEG